MPQCVECQKYIPVGMNVCPYCGTRHCARCGQKMPPGVELCPYCGVQIQPQMSAEKPHVSNKWYLLPILLGCVAFFVSFYTKFSGPSIWFVPIHTTYGLGGGAIAYLLNKRKDPKKAEKFLLVGVIMFLLSAASIWISVAAQTRAT